MEIFSPTGDRKTDVIWFRTVERLKEKYGDNWGEHMPERFRFPFNQLPSKTTYQLKPLTKDITLQKTYRNFDVPPGRSPTHTLPEQAHNTNPPGSKKNGTNPMYEFEHPTGYIDPPRPVDVPEHPTGYINPPRPVDIPTRPVNGGPWEVISPIDFKPPQTYTGPTRLPAGGPWEKISPIDLKPPQPYIRPFIWGPQGPHEVSSPIDFKPLQTYTGPTAKLPTTIGKYGGKKKGKKQKKAKKQPMFWGI